MVLCVAGLEILFELQMAYHTYALIGVFMVFIVMVFRQAWLSTDDNNGCLKVTDKPATIAAAPTNVPYSTFKGDSSNPLAQPGLLKPQNPADPNAFVPLPPVKY